MSSILIAGDLVPINRVSSLFEEKRYSDIFNQVREITQQCDYCIVNLEAPIVASNDCKPIAKSGPNLKTNSSVIEALKYAGFDAVTLANNHFRDYGNEGCQDTLRLLMENDIRFVGGGINAMEAQQTMYQQLGKGIKVAIINCCEHEYSVADNYNAGANPIEPIRQYYSIREAKTKADYVIVIVHGGIEGYQYPTPRMQEWYRFFVDCGADVVVNHHQHCYSGYETYKGKYIFYGLGNFSFDRNFQNKTSWYEGFMLKLIFDEGRIDYCMIPYVQGKEKPAVEILQETERFYSTIEKINGVINDSVALVAEYRYYLNETLKGEKYILCPYKNKYLAALYVRGFLPGFLPLSRWRALQNRINCESHRERYLYFLRNKLN